MRHTFSRPRIFDYAAAGIRAPRVGERGAYHPPIGYAKDGTPIWPDVPSWFTVTRTDGNICHVRHDDGHEDHFIWRFVDGPNTFHAWPTHDPRGLLA